MKYYLMLSATIAIALLDYHCYDVMSARGGFVAWTESNCFWQVALGYLLVFHILYGLSAWIFVEVLKEK